MKKIMGKLLALVLAAATVLSITTISAYAKDDKSFKAGKKASAAAPQTTASAAPATASETDPAWEEAVSREQARQIALDAAGVNGQTLKYLVCYVSWTDHVPTAYEVKFATRWAVYHYTIDLDTGAILESVCHSRH